MQFLADGAIIQSAADTFILFINESSASYSKNLRFYNTSFWQFTDEAADQSLAKQYSAYFEINRAQFIEHLLNAQNSAELKQDLNIRWQEPQNQAFTLQFDWIQNKIKQGQLLKGLPIILQEGRSQSALDVSKVLIHFLTKNLSEVYLYGSWTENKGFLGATPEILFRCDQNEIHTMALAGTWSKSDSSSMDFQDEKTWNEHQIVVEDIQNQMKNFKLLFQSSTHIKELKHLFHLETNFTFEHHEQPVTDIVKALHPTAALGLYPRRFELFQQFKELELQNQRGNFGAPIGFYSDQEAFVLVGIRNFYWDQKEFKIFSGCGVTERSQLQAELAELEQKRNAVKDMFGLNL